ncbi:MAG: hypothetical protein QGF20_02305 [Alphaproteobacteria bacterium]|jgi:hypothetical protein|nr:hypothetical protein [Alphaproteobacteria bacterium]|tara:strand:- start:2 stop:196 length:195 start_codon:yes stop_codon:yes gene_type:complete
MADAARSAHTLFNTRETIVLNRHRQQRKMRTRDLKMLEEGIPWALPAKAKPRFSAPVTPFIVSL